MGSSGRLFHDPTCGKDFAGREDPFSGIDGDPVSSCFLGMSEDLVSHRMEIKQPASRPLLKAG
jgi:hypothetical protein